MEDGFEWDENKARSNIERHGVSFAEARTVFADPLSLTDDDAVHSTVEDRFLIVGRSALERVLAVTYSYRDSAIRIISARKATGRERKAYEDV